MKLLYLFALSVLFSVSNPKYYVAGTVVDKSDGKAIVFGSVLLEGEGFRTGVETDSEGHFQIQNVPSGTYRLTVQYVGYETHVVEPIEVFGNVDHLEISISPGNLMEVVEILEYKKPIMSINECTSGAMLTDAKVSFLPIRNISGLVANSSGTAATSIAAELPSAGQITAGEWNDLHNWRDWEKLLQDENYSVMTEVWGIAPKERISVLVMNDKNEVLPNTAIRLYDEKDSLLWSAMADNAGKAELWPSAFKSESTAKYLIAELNGKTQKVDNPHTIDIGTNNLVLPSDCTTSEMMDISFVVDATGSMSDEIRFLQAELLDVIEASRVENPSMTFQFSTVFYRDEGEEYVVNPLPFTAIAEEVTAFIGEQEAAGGGDTPEAVEAGLESAIAMNWRTGAQKLVFLLLDAPPHSDEGAMNKYREQLQLAAEKGIKIIPITASGLDRNAEFLMKFTALLTNGTYVFITDDSGIGNKHLDPIVDDFDVELLNDLLVRLITQYAENNSCDFIPVTSKEAEISVFPNPATSQVTVKSKGKINRIKMLSNSGMLLHQETVNGKKTKIELANFVNGIYYLQIEMNNGSVETRKFIKV